jgi:hypothetical protein
MGWTLPAHFTSTQHAAGAQGQVCHRPDPARNAMSVFLFAMSVIYLTVFLFAMGVIYHSEFSFCNGRDLPWPFFISQLA